MNPILAIDAVLQDTIVVRTGGGACLVIRERHGELLLLLSLVTHWWMKSFKFYSNVSGLVALFGIGFGGVTGGEYQGMYSVAVTRRLELEKRKNKIRI